LIRVSKHPGYQATGFQHDRKGVFIFPDFGDTGIMTDYRIGVLGGYGRVGQHAVKYLAHSGHSIIIGGRDLDRAQIAVDKLGECATPHRVDINDTESLQSFCGNCDLVINCAGPFEKIRDKVALAALAKQKHYVDVSGTDSFYANLLPYREEIRKKGLIFIISAGMLPGLSGLLPIYTGQSQFDLVDFIDYFYCGMDEFTYTSAYDYVCSLNDGSGMSMAYCQKGEIVPKGAGLMHDVKIPYYEKPLDAYPYSNGEMQRISEKLGGCKVCFYYAFPGGHTFETLNYIQASRKYSTDDERHQSAELLVKSSQKDLIGNDIKQIYYIIMDGKQKGANRKVLYQTLYSRDGYELTGTIAGITSLLILAHRTTGPGIHYLPHGLNPNVFMDELKAQAVIKHFILNWEDETIMEKGYKRQ